ncbi:MFS transporter [Streptacidiphilus sp. EB129]|uniref:MFS transporter n=1 Tax=Streptacidiphilus sp. EB129 TaxID=3156262 RepID=UPI003515EAEE
MTATIALAPDVRTVASRAERLFLPATFVTLLGNNIQLIAASLLIFRTSGTAMSVGWVFIVTALPQIALSSFFGRLADRYDRRTICVITDVVSAVAALALPVWLLFGGNGIAGAYAVSLLLAVTSAMFMPASNALIKERIAPDRLGHFGANFDIAYQGGAMASGVVGGFVMQYVGLQPMFYFNGITFVFSALCLYAMGRRPAAAAEPEEPGTDAAAPAEPAVTVKAPLLRLGVLFSLGAVLVLVTNTLLLVAVIHRFHQGTGLLGVVDALAGIGMMIAATLYKRVKDKVNYRYLILFGYVGCGLALLVQPIAVWTIVPGILVGGITFGFARLASRTELMRAVDADKVGRVFGTANAFGLALSAAGTVLVAAVVDHVGVVSGFLTLGLIGIVPTVLIVSTMFLGRREAR